jgi:two-component system CheB/CheR fusion protein
VQKDSATPGVAHLRLLSDALEELCAARTEEDVVRISGAVAQQACRVGGMAVVLASGEQYQFAPGDGADALSHAIRSKVITRMSAWALESAQTAVVPDVHRDDRTRSHTNGSTFARSLVVVPVGRPTPFAAATFAWAQEHWPSAAEVLMLEALARATGLALRQRLAQSETYEHDEPGSVRTWLGSTADAEGLRGPERRHWLAVAELQHRVRNVLSLVRSLVRRTSETSVPGHNYAEHLEGRIGALARIQGMVIRRPGGGVDLEKLIDAEIDAHAALDRRVKVAGPHVRLRAKAAETIGLALHELAINALKYGPLGTPEGRITITWRLEMDRDPRCLRIEWIEDGLPPDAPTSPHRGFGRDLIERTVPYELRGTTRFLFEPGGVHCIIDVPMTPDLVVLDPTVAV